MANRIQKAMFPQCEIYKMSLHEGTFHTFLPSFSLFYFNLFLNSEKDGQQALDFYWTDPIEAIKSYIAKNEI